MPLCEPAFSLRNIIMTHELRQLKQCAWLALVIAGLCGLSATARAEALPLLNDSLYADAILFIGHLNPDCLADTVMGRSNLHDAFLPHRIIWGRATALNTGCPDTTGGSIPDSLKKSCTYLKYPGWGSFTGSSAMFQTDPDSLDDLMLYMWGNAGSEENPLDTGTTVVVFGQHGLNTIDTITVQSIDMVQYDPYYARHLVVGMDFIEPDVRDISGDTSYILRKIPAREDDNQQSPIASANPGEGSVVARQVRVSVHPNPVKRYAVVSADMLHGSSCIITMHTSDGSEVLRKEAGINASGGVNETLDLENISSGAYVIRIQVSGASIGDCPVMVVR